MRSIVEAVIYFYMFICVALMVFNILYIVRASIVERRHEQRARYWKRQIDKAGDSFELNQSQVNKLKNVQQFASFHRAVLYWVLGTEGSDKFFCDNARQIQELAVDYTHREAMERAFMASFIASFRCPRSYNAGILSEILLTYLENSTVFCRENVLQALYALGRPHAIENAFHIINEHEWYHSPKLLSDGLTMYTGDMEELVLALWRNREHWADYLTRSVVQFATFLDSPQISDQFEKALLHEGATSEVRFALMRYFQRHPSQSVLPVLLESLNNDDQFAVQAASTLGAYDTQASREALKQALHSPNWHVRHNAATSLKYLGLTAQERDEIVATDDRYAIEMLDFVLGPTSSGGGA